MNIGDRASRSGGGGLNEFDTENNDTLYALGDKRPRKMGDFKKPKKP